MGYVEKINSLGLFLTFFLVIQHLQHFCNPFIIPSFEPITLKLLDDNSSEFLDSVGVLLFSPAGLLGTSFYPWFFPYYWVWILTAIFLIILFRLGDKAKHLAIRDDFRDELLKEIWSFLTGWVLTGEDSGLQSKACSCPRGVLIHPKVQGPAWSCNKIIAGIVGDCIYWRRRPILSISTISPKLSLDDVAFCVPFDISTSIGAKAGPSTSPCLHYRSIGMCINGRLLLNIFNSMNTQRCVEDSSRRSIYQINTRYHS